MRTVSIIPLSCVIPVSPLNATRSAALTQGLLLSSPESRAAQERALWTRLHIPGWALESSLRPRSELPVRTSRRRVLFENNVSHGMPHTQERPCSKEKSQMCIRNPEQNYPKRIQSRSPRKKWTGWTMLKKKKRLIKTKDI